MKSFRINTKSWLVSLALVMCSMFSTTSAHAADGCKFLLCIAGPWASIAECRPTVREVFRDLARGRAFPTCAMSGAGNSANNVWVDQPACPSMYRQYDTDTGAFIGCMYPGRISVNVNGSLWSQVYWDMGGNTTTWYSSTAQSSLTQQPNSPPLDDRFVNDLAAWNSTKVAECQANSGTPAFDQFGAFQSCTLPWWTSSR